MPGRFWKWRMQGGAMDLASLAMGQLASTGAPDVIVATDMVNLPAWLGLMRRTPAAQTPLLLYMHENQLTYPWRSGEKPDLTYGMVNWLSQLCADAVVFNSRFHLDGWFSEVPRLLKHFPDANHLHRIADVKAKSAVLPVGIEMAGLDGERDQQGSSMQAPLILWNQRWEYDKRPDRFFKLLYRLQEAGAPFRLAVAGENFRMWPDEFVAAKERLAGRIVHWGYVETRAAYCRLLHQADLVISTADHEFFGVSILEAVAAGALPLLPRRLSYPELIPSKLHAMCLYGDEEDLFEKAANLLHASCPAPPDLRRHVHEQYAWLHVAALYDEVVERLARWERPQP
jgi:glycosyltransferase involved in cell wall biosynthesis